MNLKSLVTLGDKGSPVVMGCALFSSHYGRGNGDMLSAAQLAEMLAAAWRCGERPRRRHTERCNRSSCFSGCCIARRARRKFVKDASSGRRRNWRNIANAFPIAAQELQSFFDSCGSTSESVDSLMFPVCGETAAGCRLIAELGHRAKGAFFSAEQTALADRLVVLKMGPCDCHEHLALSACCIPILSRSISCRICPSIICTFSVCPTLAAPPWPNCERNWRAIPIAQRTGGDLLAALDRIQASRPTAAAQTGTGTSGCGTALMLKRYAGFGACLAEPRCITPMNMGCCTSTSSHPTCLWPATGNPCCWTFI